MEEKFGKGITIHNVMMKIDKSNPESSYTKLTSRLVSAIDKGVQASQFGEPKVILQPHPIGDEETNYMEENDV